MGRAFLGCEGGLRPEFRFLKDKAVIIQAWKKAHGYIRAHNWYSDNKLRIALWLLARWLLLMTVVLIALFCGTGLLYKYCILPSYEVWKPALDWVREMASSFIGMLICLVGVVFAGKRFIRWWKSVGMDEETPDKAFEPARLVADSPIRNGKDDLLSRGAYVQMLASLVMSRPSEDGARFIGVYAPWGEGKTSVRNLLEAHIVEDYGNQRVVFVDFAPWEYPDNFDVASVFFEKLAQSVSGVCNPGMGSLFAQVARMMALRRVNQSAGTVQEVLDFFRRLWFRFVMSERALQRALYELLRNSHKRIVVVVDDLERLPKDEVCRVVRFLKAHGDIPCLTYLVLADEDYLATSVAGMVGDSKTTTAEQGRAYLEKIVPIRCPLPDINGNVLLTVFKREIDELLQAYDLPAIETTEHWDLVLPYLQNVRKLKILVNAYSVQLATFKRKVAGRQYLNVHLGDLLALTAMKVFEPTFYSTLSNGYWKVYQEMSFYSQESGLSEEEYQKEFFVQRKILRPDVVQSFLGKVVGIVQVGGDKVRYRLSNPRSAALLKDYRLASLYCFSNYFISENEDVQLPQDDLQAFLAAVRACEVPSELVDRLDHDGMLPFLFYALEEQGLFESREESDAYLRILVSLSAMRLRERFLPEYYEQTSLFGRTGIYTRIFRCLLFYCTKIKQALMSGKTYYGMRTSHVGDVLLPILEAINDDVYILSEFVAYDDEHHKGAGHDYDAYFSNVDYERLKNIYLDRIVLFQKSGMLVQHPEFFDLFRTWTILLTRQGTPERIGEFRISCESLLHDPIAIPKMLIFFTRDNRASGSASDQLEVFIDLARFDMLFGVETLPTLLSTMEAMPSLDLYAFHALISLRYVVEELGAGHPCESEEQKKHLLDWIKTDDYQKERELKVGE